MRNKISSSLEDYLETIYLLQRDHGFARVKEIAAARDVKAASVSVALRKLAEVKLVRYERREYINLTPEGENTARSIFSRHRLLKRFFCDVLQMSLDGADEQACALEHSLTDEGMDRLVRFLEFLNNCPSIVSDFKKCLEQDECPKAGSAECEHCNYAKEVHRTVASLDAGEPVIVSTITASDQMRQHLLNIGILPGSRLEVEKRSKNGASITIRVHKTSLTITAEEAAAIIVR